MSKLTQQDFQVVENALVEEFERLAAGAQRHRVAAVKLEGLSRKQKRLARRAFILVLRRFKIPFTVLYDGWRLRIEVDDTRKVRDNLEAIKGNIASAVRFAANIRGKRKRPHTRGLPYLSNTNPPAY